MSLDKDSAVMNSDKKTSQGAYRVLARKWRPLTFKDMVGQGMMVQILTNALKTNRLAHAFILTGERGVGKTSTARILARAINCIGNKNSESCDPCGECSPCLEILEERSMDVIEMDAASHTGVDDVREIIDGARYRPASCHYKVYIIDEVHMLSKNAFNALLKTLEEPPPHVKFIFATTEIHKVPVTILSRCQRFDLKRISSQDLENYLGHVLKEEGASATKEALSLLVRFADGSLRDGMSLLDQSLNLAEKKNGTLEIHASEVREMLGLMDGEKVLDLFEASHQGDLSKILSLMDEFYRDGGDSSQLIKDLLEITCTLSRLKVDPDYNFGLMVKALGQRLRILSEKLSVPVLQRTWQILSKGWEEVRVSPVPIMATQMIVFRLSYVQDLPALHTWPSFKGFEDVKQQSEKVTASEYALDAREDILEKPSEKKNSESMESPRLFENLEDIANLLLQHKEMRLYAMLCQDAHLVALQDPMLSLRVNSEDRNFHLHLGRVLTTLTGRKWTINLSDEKGQLSLSEKKKSFENARFEEAKREPLLQEVLKVFENAQIEKIIDEPKE